SSSSQTISTMRSNEPAVITTYSHSDIAASASAAASTSPSTLTPTIAWRRKPTVSGSVTATICITPWSSSFCTRWRTAASDRPTALPMAAYGRRPSSWSCSMMARETASSCGPPPFLDSLESLGSALRLATRSLCTTSRQFRKARSMKFVVTDPRSCGFRRCGVARGVENVRVRTRVGVSEVGHLTAGHLGHQPGAPGGLAVSTELRRLRNYIGGEFRDAADGRTTQVVNPATGEAYATAPLSGQADVDAAMAAAAEAFPGWRDTTPAERQKALLKIADLFEERAEELIAAEVENTGKPIGLTRTEEIPPMVDQIRFFAGAARMLEGKGAGEYMEGLTSFVRREPVGVCAQVAPWNYPMMMAVWKFAPAIAAGNTVVLKPSDTTPASTVLLAEILGSVLPKGVFNVVCGDRDTGRLMVEHPTPAMASITGSVRAGMSVAESASKDLKRVHLELGGKAPVVVFEDTDIPKAVEDISTAGFFNAGQDCTAATRVLVHESIHDEFVSALAKAAADIKTGMPDDEDVLYGPLNNPSQLKQVEGFIERLPAHARVEAGGKRVGDRGYFYAPTVVSGLKQDDEIIQKEVFGPVITVQRFTDEDQAVEYANGVEYALASSVWTKDHSRAMRMSKKLDFGCVWINTHIPLVAEMPQGGFKKSGYGKDLSAYGFDDYTRIKHVMTSLDA